MGPQIWNYLMGPIQYNNYTMKSWTEWLEQIGCQQKQHGTLNRKLSNGTPSMKLLRTTDGIQNKYCTMENSLVSLKQYGTQLKYYKIPNWKLLNGTQKLKVLRTQDGTPSNYFPVNWWNVAPKQCFTPQKQYGMPKSKLIRTIAGIQTNTAQWKAELCHKNGMIS